jgi:hypothetical protein
MLHEVNGAQVTVCRTTNSSHLEVRICPATQATLIYNPYAGFDDWQLHVEATADYWRARAWEITLRQTEYPAHATELAAAAARAGINSCWRLAATAPPRSRQRAARLLDSAGAAASRHDQLFHT